MWGEGAFLWTSAVAARIFKGSAALGREGLRADELGRQKEVILDDLSKMVWAERHGDGNPGNLAVGGRG